jgi:hypothetical protein
MNAHFSSPDVATYLWMTQSTISRNPERQHRGVRYSVALFHQLHCLGAIRDHYWKLLDSILNHDEKLQDLAETLKSSHHINHCYDYIRQSLQCSGDMSLEWPRTEHDGRRFVVDGWNIPHQCKSWVSYNLWQHRGQSH